MRECTEERIRKWVKRKIAEELGCSVTLIRDDHEIDEDWQYNLLLKLFMAFGETCHLVRGDTVDTFVSKVVQRFFEREHRARIVQRELERRYLEDPIQTEITDLLLMLIPSLPRLPNLWVWLGRLRSVQLRKIHV